ncbi:MAG: hypothetical protein ACI8W7_003128 [Gammaproteobacteria bacterium]
MIHKEQKQMKINVSVDCTPQELRDFLGWPDVGDIQQQMLERVSKLMADGVGEIDPVSLMRPFLAPNTQAMDSAQKAFLQAMQAAMGASNAGSNKPGKG